MLSLDEYIASLNAPYFLLHSQFTVEDFRSTIRTLETMPRYPIKEVAPVDSFQIVHTMTEHDSMNEWLWFISSYIPRDGAIIHAKPATIGDQRVILARAVI